MEPINWFDASQLSGVNGAIKFRAHVKAVYENNLIIN